MFNKNYIGIKRRDRREMREELPPLTGFFNSYRIKVRFSNTINSSTAPIERAAKVSFAPKQYFPIIININIIIFNNKSNKEKRIDE